MCILPIAGVLCIFCFFFFQAEDGIRDLVRSRGLGDVYKRQEVRHRHHPDRQQRGAEEEPVATGWSEGIASQPDAVSYTHLTLPTSDLV